jgi:adenylosuccinate synthase
MMKGDVLNGLESISAATAYSINGKSTNEVPANLCSANIIPEYLDFKGWSENISLDGGFENMDQTFQDYVDYVEKYIGAKIGVISMGPGRDETLTR